MMEEGQRISVLGSFCCAGLMKMKRAIGRTDEPLTEMCDFLGSLCTGLTHMMMTDRWKR